MSECHLGNNCKRLSVDCVQNTSNLVSDNTAQMADNVKSRSRRRRNRRRCKKLSVHQQLVEIVEVSDNGDKDTKHDEQVEQISAKNIEEQTTSEEGSGSKTGEETKTELMEENYRVDSPKTVMKETGNMKKSRSLDDDDVKITEVVTDGESEINESTAVVSEADSDVEWEKAENLMVQHNLEQHCGRLSTISIPLVKQLDTNPSLSEENEKHLRSFLGNLNLVESIEDSAKRSGKPVDKARLEKLKKRQAVAQHFLPYYQNPRYLDVISEESDISDKDTEKFGYNSRPLIIDPKRGKEAILVDTKFDTIETGDNTIQCPWSTSVTESASGAEVVYLEDSSTSVTPSDLLEHDESVDADVEDEDSVDFDSFETVKMDESDKNDEIKTDDEDLLDTSKGILELDDIIKESEISSLEKYKSRDLTQNLNQEKYSEKINDIFDTVTKLPTDLWKRNSSTEETKQEHTVERDYKDVIQVLEELEKSTKPTDENTQLKSDTETEFDIEFQAFCDELRKSDKQDSRPSSASSDRSSRSTSQCTAVYNPAHSSLTNIAAVLREGSSEQRCNQPDTLKDICLNSLMSLPFGSEIIEELANVSVSIDKITDHIYSRLKSSIPNQHKDINHNSCTGTKWVGMPTEEDPKLLVCLSPSQKNYIETVRKPPKEADCLLDLHKKYMERSHEYHTTQQTFSNNLYDLKIDKNKTDEKYKRNSSYIDYENYTKSRFPQVFRHKLTSSDDGNINYNTYIKKLTREVPIEVEKQLHKPVNNLVYSEDQNISDYFDKKLEDMNEKHTERIIPIRLEETKEKIVPIRIEETKERIIPIRIDDDYVRPRSRSDATPKERIIPIRLDYNTDDESKNRPKPELCRRYSLPYDLFEKQLKDILEKEKKIEIEIKKLEEERKKLEEASKKLQNVKENGIREENLKTNLDKTEKIIKIDRTQEYLKSNKVQKENAKSNGTQEKNVKSNSDKTEKIIKIERTEENLKNGEETNVNTVENLRNKFENEFKANMTKNFDKNSTTEKFNETKFEKSSITKNKFDVENYLISKKGDIAILQNEKTKLIPQLPGELFRQKMYNEWIDEVTERQERKQHKVIKITKTENLNKTEKPSGLGDEFMAKAKERIAKLGLEEETKEENTEKSEVEHIVVINDGKLTESSNLPKHLQEFIGYVQQSDDGESLVLRIVKSAFWFVIIRVHNYMCKTINKFRFNSL